MSLHEAFLDYIHEVVGMNANDNGWSAARVQDEVSATIRAFKQYPLRRVMPAAGEKGVSVYVIEDCGLGVKIGVSNNPHWRLEALSAGNARGLLLAYATRAYSRSFALAIEAAVHDHLATHSLGREWFGCSVETATQTINQFGGVR